MKRNLLLVGAAIAAVLLWRSLQEQQAQRDLWTEVTDPLP
jgi:hypothetical protein